METRLCGGGGFCLTIYKAERDEGTKEWTSQSTGVIFVLVYFTAAVIRHPVKSNLQGKGLFWSQLQRDNVILWFLL